MNGMRAFYTSDRLWIETARHVANTSATCDLFAPTIFTKRKWEIIITFCYDTVVRSTVRTTITVAFVV